MEMNSENRSEVITIVDDIYYPSMLSIKDDGIVFDVGDVPYDVPMDWHTAGFQVTPEEIGNHAPQERARYRLYDTKGNEFPFIDLEHGYEESIDRMNAFLDALRGEPEPEPEPWVPEDFDAEPEEEPASCQKRTGEPRCCDAGPDEYEGNRRDTEAGRRTVNRYASGRASREPYRRRESTTFRRHTRHNHRGLDYKELRREREAREADVFAPRLREERRHWEALHRRR